MATIKADAVKRADARAVAAKLASSRAAEEAEAAAAAAAVAVEKAEAEQRATAKHTLSTSKFLEFYNEKKIEVRTDWTSAHLTTYQRGKRIEALNDLVHDIIKVIGTQRGASAADWEGYYDQLRTFVYAEGSFKDKAVKLWTSADRLRINGDEAHELCSIINAIIRDDVPGKLLCVNCDLNTQAPHPYS